MEMVSKIMRIFTKVFFVHFFITKKGKLCYLKNLKVRYNAHYTKLNRYDLENLLFIDGCINHDSKVFENV